jgi:NAD(P)-dependent dehydrogenase (short-subunit alcohol dehydrogenase family)
MKLSNRKAIITGAAGGMGTVFTKRFLAEGALVCAVDTTDDALKKLKSDLGSPSALITIEADISSEDDATMLSDTLRAYWGDADILVNNAGWFPFTDFEDITYEEWKKVIAINLDGPFLVTRAVLPLLKKGQAGRIINIGSGSIFSGPPNQLHYVSAKSGITGFTRSLANILGSYNITVNMITPGLTVTPNLLKVAPPEMIKKIEESGALKRKQQAEDLVGAVIFLASDDAAFITGQTINIDGGRTFI